MGNVRSLLNKMDDLTVLTQHQRDYRECSIMVLTKMRLTALTLDTDANLDGFQLRRADRTAESGKRKEEGLAVIVNDRWCNSGHIIVKEQVCSKDIKLLAVSMKLNYLSRKRVREGKNSYRRKMESAAAEQWQWSLEKP